MRSESRAALHTNAKYLAVQQLNIRVPSISYFSLVGIYFWHIYIHTSLQSLRVIHIVSHI